MASIYQSCDYYYAGNTATCRNMALNALDASILTGSTGKTLAHHGRQFIIELSLAWSGLNEQVLGVLIGPLFLSNLLFLWGSLYLYLALLPTSVIAR